jgi:hypothetical protein
MYLWYKNLMETAIVLLAALPVSLYAAKVAGKGCY